MAAPENMKAEKIHASDSAPTAQKDEIGQRGVKAAPEMEEERVLEPETDPAGKRPQVEGRRRTRSNGHAPPSQDGLGDRIEEPQETPPVRLKPGNEESGRPIRDNMDVEGGSLG